MNGGDGLLSPRLMRAFLGSRRDELVVGRVVECRFYTLWNDPGRYRDYSMYQPYWNRLGFVDDRRADYDRSAWMVIGATVVLTIGAWIVALAIK